MAVMNWENSRRGNEASSRRNNDDPIEDEEENNAHNTHGREETYQRTITQGLLIYLGSFLEFIMSIALPKNFQLLTMLKHV